MGAGHRQGRRGNVIFCRSRRAFVAILQVPSVFFRFYENVDVTLMEVSLKMATLVHSNQCVGICSEACGVQSKEQGSVLGKREHPPPRSLGGLRAAVHEGGRKGSPSFCFSFLLSGSSEPPLLVPGRKHPLRCQSYRQLGCLPACSA